MPNAKAKKLSPGQGRLIIEVTVSGKNGEQDVVRFPVYRRSKSNNYYFYGNSTNARYRLRGVDKEFASLSELEGAVLGKTVCQIKEPRKSGTVYHRTSKRPIWPGAVRSPIALNRLKPRGSYPDVYTALGLVTSVKMYGGGVVLDPSPDDDPPPEK